MATLPPRRNPTPTKISKQHLTPLQILLQMGFPKHRAEKALAATGNRGVQLASDWLLAHVNDIFLDDTTPREYILYACPVGGFLEDLRNLWGLSMTCCGWNGAHNFTPHITLVSFFKAPDENSPYLAQALKSVMERQGATLNESLKLETYISPNFMGLFVADEHADYLKRIAMQYVKEVSNAIISDTYEHFDALTACFPWCSNTTARCIPRGSRSISLEPHVKSLHLTLAYQFPSQHYAQLKGLVEFLNPNASSEWELRLYSRDARVNGKQVHKVVHAYTPQENDELELHIGDYVYLTSDAVANSPDGWVEGVSWLTGLSGLLPASYTIRTAESDAWTLHTKVALNSLSMSSSASACPVATASSSEDAELSSSSPSVNSVATTAAPAPATLRGGLDEGDGGRESDPLGAGDGECEQVELRENGGKDGVYENMAAVIKRGPLENDYAQKLFIMRHGERVDFTYGAWIPYCFDEHEVYTRRDLNMPATVPNRKKGAKGFQKDSPLTNVGTLQATLVGEGLLAEKVIVAHVYCSPSLRCIQTCDAVLKGLGLRSTVQINVEPGLFEWLVWYPEYFPDWLDTDELIFAGFNINANYIPFVSKEKLVELPETCEQFYHRSNYVSQSALGAHKTGDVLFVGHATTLEVCSRELAGGKPLDAKEMTKILKKVSYCSLVTLRKEADDTWTKIEPPCPPVTHSNNPRFDWKIVC